MMRIAALLAACAAAAYAQGSSVAGDVKMTYHQVKGYILKSADKMPEEHYSFKPVPEVRSFGQLLGHIADAQYVFCGSATGSKPETSGIEKSKTTKSELTAALKEAFAYCDEAYNQMTDSNAGETVKLFGRDRARAGVLAFNNAHDYEHYGNLVTYMRLKGLVPPSSEGRR
jgi:uncharacterized damage-inducible protein DinB